MPGPAKHPVKTRDLLSRVEAGDREAAFDLARLLRPDTLTELVEFVSPLCPPTPALFDVLADAHSCYRLDQAYGP